MARTIDAGPATLGLGALLLLVALFLPWFDGASAWTVFEALDLVLGVLALTGLAVAAGRVPAAGPRGRLAIALAALVVVAVQLADPPPVVGAHPDRGAGAWLALVSSLLMLAGAALSIARFSVRVDVRERDRHDRAGDAPTTVAPTPTAGDQRTQPMSRLLGDDDPR